MKTQTTTILNGRWAAILLLLALGQFGSIAHENEHGIFDAAERCATCVHLDQPAQPGNMASLALRVPPADTVVVPDLGGQVVGRPPAPFHSRAPPA